MSSALLKIIWNWLLLFQINFYQELLHTKSEAFSSIKFHLSSFIEKINWSPKLRTSQYALGAQAELNLTWYSSVLRGLMRKRKKRKKEKTSILETDCRKQVSQPREAGACCGSSICFENSWYIKHPENETRGTENHSNHNYSNEGS